MNKDELLKIYSAYLPYDLEFEAFGRRGKINEIQLKPDFVLGLDIDSHVRHFYPDSGLPIFYPLEYLTKEIEHEGEKIIPIEKLFGSALAISGYTVYQDFQYKEFAHLTYVKYGLKPFPFLFEHYQKLLEWHFNIFQLPEDQFINKATLTNK